MLLYFQVKLVHLWTRKSEEGGVQSLVAHLCWWPEGGRWTSSRCIKSSSRQNLAGSVPIFLFKKVGDTENKSEVKEQDACLGVYCLRVM